MGTALNSALWMPEDQYHQWQGDEFAKQAQAIAFPKLAQKQIELGPPQPPPEPPVSPPLEPSAGVNNLPAPPMPGGPAAPPMPPPEAPAAPMPDFLGSMGNAVGAGLGAVGATMGSSPEGQVAGAVGGAIGEPFKSTMYPYLPQAGFDPAKALQMANDYASQQQAGQETQALRDPTGSFISAALSYPAGGIAGIPSKAGAEAMARVGAARLGEGLGNAGESAGARLGQLATDETGALQLPSGRVPGGIQNMTPIGAPNDLQRMRDALTPEQKSVWQNLSDAKDSFLRNFYDKNALLTKLQNETDIPVHDLAQVVPGARAHGEAILERDFMPVVTPLGKDVKSLEEYMTIMRAYDLKARNPHIVLPGDMTDPGAALGQLANELGPDRFAAVKGAAEQLWGAPGRPRDGLLYQNILQPLVDEGILSDAAVQRMQSANPHYIDWHREIGNLLENPYTRSPQTANVSTTGINTIELAGSTRNLDEPLARSFAQVTAVQERVARNKAARYMYGALDQLGQAKPHTGTGLPGEGMGAISFFRDGKQFTGEVPEVYATVAKGLEADPMNTLTKVLSFFPNILRAGATAYNPAFMIVNPLRDITTAGFQTGWKTVLSPEMAKGWLAAFTHNADYFNAAKDGALMGGLIDSYRTTEAMARIPQHRLWQIPLDNAADVVKFIPRLIEEVNMATERGTRIGVKLAMESKGLSPLKAAVTARDATVDFSKSGNTIKALNQAIPFLNAGVQGASNFAKVVKNNPKAALIGSAPLIGMSLLSYANNTRFGSSNLIPDYEYNNNWIFVVGEGKTNPDPKTGESTTYPIYAKIPKGPIAAAVTAAPEVAMRFMTAKGDYSLANDMGQSIWGALGALSPVSLSPSSFMLPGIGTAGELAANKDLYTGREIVPPKEQIQPTALQYGADTSRPAVALGQLTGQSPRNIDYAVKGITAGTGQAVMGAVDAAMAKAGYNPQVPGESKLQTPTADQQLARTPVISRFLGVKNNETERQGYEARNQAIQQSRNDFSKVADVIRLGLGLRQVPDTFTVNGVERKLTLPEQAAYQRASTTVMVGAIPQLEATPLYRQADDSTKTAIIQEVMSNSRNYVRKQIAAGKAPVTDAGAKEVAQATQDMAAYRAMPKFVIPMDKKKEQSVVDAMDRIKAQERKLPVSVSGALDFGMQKEFQKAGSSEDRTALMLAYTILQNQAKFVNPRRRVFWAQHPTLQKYYSDVSLD